MPPHKERQVRPLLQHPIDNQPRPAFAEGEAYPQAMHDFNTKAMTAISASVNPSVMAESSYPRPLHPGGFSLPPLVEDRLFITNIEEEGREEENRSSLSSSSAHHLLLVRPPDTDSLWE